LKNKEKKDIGSVGKSNNKTFNKEYTANNISEYIDHTLLKPEATVKDIKKLCSEAKEYKFAAVCISPSYVELATRELKGSEVIVCTVIGFPSGAHEPEVKMLETKRAIENGAKEIDMVINIGALKSKNYDLVFRDIKSVCEICEKNGVHCKVIIETAMLTYNEKVKACELVKNGGANFVKTSTGYGPHGATVEDVKLMSSVMLDSGIEIKAAGGIRTLEKALDMINAGATRIGTSSGINIVKATENLSI